jgi:hypothetical protein
MYQCGVEVYLIITYELLGVGIAAGLLKGQSSSPDRVKIFLFSTSSRSALGHTQLPIQWVPVALSPGVNRPGREADHSPPTSAEIKKTLIYMSTPIRLHGIVLNHLSTGANLLSFIYELLTGSLPYT